MKQSAIYCRVSTEDQEKEGTSLHTQLDACLAYCKQKGYQIAVGKAFYSDTAMGAAMGEPEGFVKVIVEHETGIILGGHIIGPEASNLIQEITTAMNTETRSYAPILRAMHVHPALCEVVQRAFGNLHPA